MGANFCWCPSGPSPLHLDDLHPRLLKRRRWGKRRAKGEGTGEGHESAGRVKRLRRKKRHAVKMFGFDD